MRERVLPLIFENDHLKVLDQRKLPHEEIYINCHTLNECFDAIKSMAVRGAPCIGFTGIFGLALWLKNNQYDPVLFKKASEYIISARPTAVNLEFEVLNTISYVEENICGDRFYLDVVKYAQDQILKLESDNLSMAHLAHKELKRIYPRKKSFNILTHCNTGFLACGCIGTALGVIEYLKEHNQIEKVWVDETRPYLQGSRLTAYELTKLGVDHEIIVEGAASLVMSQGLVDAIFVGADRIAANGDTANKIGTANLSIIAKYYKVPFFIVAPKSSFDVDISSGDEIEIELRPESEIKTLANYKISPVSSKAFNPSFDITKGENIVGIITQDKCLKSPYLESISEVFYE